MPRGAELSFIFTSHLYCLQSTVRTAVAEASTVDRTVQRTVQRTTATNNVGILYFVRLKKVFWRSDLDTGWCQQERRKLFI